MGVMIRLPVAANRALTTETDFMFPGQIQTFNTGLQVCTTRQYRPRSIFTARSNISTK
jgi:hypothetical protein